MHIYIIRRIVRIDFRIRLGTWYWLLDEYLIDEMRIDIGRVIFQEHITAVRLLFMKLEMRNAVGFCDTVKTDGLKAVRISCINAKFPIFRIDVQIQSDIRIVLMGDHQFGTLVNCKVYCYIIFVCTEMISFSLGYGNLSISIKNQSFQYNF